MAGRQPQDVPTHSSPAASRQAHARSRPRVAVSGPAYHPRPAQPNRPAPLSEGKTWQEPDSRPHTSHWEGQASHPARPPEDAALRLTGSRGPLQRSVRSRSRPSPQSLSWVLRSSHPAGLATQPLAAGFWTRVLPLVSPDFFLLAKLPRLIELKICRGRGERGESR